MIDKSKTKNLDLGEYLLFDTARSKVNELAKRKIDCKKVSPEMITEAMNLVNDVRNILGEEYYDMIASEFEEVINKGGGNDSIYD